MAGMRLTSIGLTAALLTVWAATPAMAQERDAKRREAARAEQNAQRQAQPQREAARSGEQPRAAEQPRTPEQPRRAEQARPRPDGARVQAPIQAPSVQTPSVQAPAVRGKSYEEALDYLTRRDQISAVHSAFRRGYERGRQYRDSLGPTADGGARSS